MGLLNAGFADNVLIAGDASRGYGKPITAFLPQLKAAIPGAVNVAVLTDRTITIRASVADVQFTLMLSVVLVVELKDSMLR